MIRERPSMLRYTYIACLVTTYKSVSTVYFGTILVSCINVSSHMKCEHGVFTAVYYFCNAGTLSDMTVSLD